MKRLLALSATAVAATALVLTLGAPSSVSAATPTTKATAKSQQGGQQGGPGAGMRRGPGGGQFLEAAAKAIGVTTDELQKQLAAGKSMADVAATKNVSADKVVDAILAAQRAQVVEMVNAKGGFMMRGPGGPGGPDGDDDHGGGQGGGQSGTSGATGEALKTCLKGKGIDPTKTPTDATAKAARAKALKECIKAGAA